MVDLKESPSQTAGPYVHIGCVPQTAGLEQRAMGPQLGTEMIAGEVDGQRISLEIHVIDGGGEPVTDALLEIWQASPQGHFTPTASFSNWGRQATDQATGCAVFDTLKPGAVQGQAPHILVWLVARGINLGLTTRIYFPDDDPTQEHGQDLAHDPGQDSGQDPVLALVGSRADTLIAVKTETGYSHTIRLQGEDETVFFDV